ARRSGPPVVSPAAVCGRGGRRLPGTARARVDEGRHGGERARCRLDSPRGDAPPGREAGRERDAAFAGRGALMTRIPGVVSQRPASRMPGGFEAALWTVLPLLVSLAALASIHPSRGMIRLAVLS